MMKMLKKGFNFMFGKGEALEVSFRVFCLINIFVVAMIFAFMVANCANVTLFFGGLFAIVIWVMLSFATLLMFIMLAGL